MNLALSIYLIYETLDSSSSHLELLSKVIHQRPKMLLPRSHQRAKEKTTFFRFDAQRHRSIDGDSSPQFNDYARKFTGMHCFVDGCVDFFLRREDLFVDVAICDEKKGEIERKRASDSLEQSHKAPIESHQENRIDRNPPRTTRVSSRFFLISPPYFKYFGFD
jgi:hypothetical protein